MADAPSLLRFDHVSMEFPGVKALDDVSFGVRAGVEVRTPKRAPAPSFIQTIGTPS